MGQTEPSHSDHILCFVLVFSCQLEAEETDEYGNGEVCGLARQRVITKRAHLSERVLKLTFPSILLAPRPCMLAAGLSDGSEFGCTASETHVKGTINELCRVRSILKAMLFEERKRKVSFHQCLRGTLPGVESAH